MNIFKKPDIGDKALIACKENRSSKDKKEVFRKDKKRWKNNRIPKK